LPLAAHEVVGRPGSLRLAVATACGSATAAGEAVSVLISVAHEVL